MQVNVRFPNFETEFLDLVDRSEKKGCSARIGKNGDEVNVVVLASRRVVGKFLFAIDEKNIILERYSIIEREFNPREYAIYELAKFLDKQKITAICWIS